MTLPPQYAAAGSRAPGAPTRVLIPAQTGTLVAGAVTMLILGGLVVFAPFMPSEWIDEPPPTGVAIVGGVFFAIGLAMLLGLRRLTRRRWFEADSHELRYVDPKMPGEQWNLPWNIIHRIEVRVGQVRKAPNSKLGNNTMPKFRVRIFLYTTHDAIPQRFRSLNAGAGADGPGSYLMVLGNQRKMVPELDAFLRANAGRRYTGVVDGGLVNFSL